MQKTLIAFLALVPASGFIEIPNVRHALAAGPYTQISASTTRRSVYSATIFAYEIGQDDPVASRDCRLIADTDQAALNQLYMIMSAWGQSLNRSGIRWTRMGHGTIAKTPVANEI